MFNSKINSHQNSFMEMTPTAPSDSISDWTGNGWWLEVGQGWKVKVHIQAVFLPWYWNINMHGQHKREELFQNFIESWKMFFSQLTDWMVHMSNSPSVWIPAASFFQFPAVKTGHTAFLPPSRPLTPHVGAVWMRLLDPVVMSSEIRIRISEK